MRRQQLNDDQPIISCRQRMAQLMLLVAWACTCVVGQPATAQDAAPEEPAPTETKETKTREPIYDPKANAKEQIDAALKLAKRDNKRVLVKFGGNWCGWCFKLHDVFTKHDVIAPLVDNEYQVVLVDVDGNRELLESYGKGNAEHGFPFLTVLDAEGKVLVNQNTSDLEDGPKHDPKKVEEFLRKWVATKKNAADVLEQALAKARKNDKHVLVHFGAPWCGWCHRLTDLLAELDDDLNRDYVVVKIDTARMLMAKRSRRSCEAAKARIQSGGIPWMVVLDAAGKALVTSDGPKGNIGCPYEPWEIEHFVSMLDKTRRGLGKDDLERIRARNENTVEKWRQSRAETRIRLGYYRTASLSILVFGTLRRLM